MKVLHVVYTEDALLERHMSLSADSQARRGFMNLRQVEGVHFVSAGDYAQLPQRDNMHYNGSSSGNALQGVGAPSLLRDGWMMSVAEKTLLMSDGKSDLEIADMPGEAGGEDSDIESRPPVAKKARSDDDKVPFKFMQMTPELYEEILHRAGARAVIDLTASDGVLAVACLSKGVPYFGICHNSSHVAALTMRLQSKVFSMLADEGLPFFNGALAELLTADLGAGVPEVVDDVEVVRRATKVKGRGKGRKWWRRSTMSRPAQPRRTKRTKAIDKPSEDHDDQDQHGEDGVHLSNSEHDTQRV